MSKAREKRGRATGSHRHGNIFSRDSGSMLIHVQRENGLAHRTMVFRPWQVQVLRVVTSRWFLALFALGVLSWAVLAVQSARVPLLTQRISHLEDDSRRLDTLQQTLGELQARYEQIQRLLSSAAKPTESRAAINGPVRQSKSAPKRDSATIKTSR